MALFDPERERIVIRVVYDGPGHAGKTTNLARLCKSFASWRRSDMVSPNTLGERTQYFDWLEVDGGLLAGYPIRAQLLTVPGQRELTLRRNFVIERADVVVFVADSQPGSIPESRAFYSELCGQLERFPDPVPIVLQANKQDLRGALPPVPLAKAICDGLRPPAQIVGSVASTDKGVKQTLTFALKLGSDLVRKRLLGQKVQSIAGAAGDAAATYAALERHEASASGRHLTPVLPSPSLPSTHVWPPMTARALLESLAGARLEQLSNAADPRGLVLEGNGWRLATSPARCYEDEAAGLSSMALLAGRKVALGAWLPEPCAVAVQPDPSGRVWLWTIDPILPSLAELLSSPDPRSRAAGLAGFAEVVTGALALAETRGILVDLDPACFAVQSATGDRDRTRYVGTRLDPGDQIPGVAELVFAVARHYGPSTSLADFVATLRLGFESVPIQRERRFALQREFIAVEANSADAARIQDAVVIALARPAKE